MQNEHRSMLHGEAPEAALDAVTIHHVIGLVATRGMQVGQQSQGVAEDAPSSGLCVAAPDDQPVGPRVEPGRVAQLTDVTPCLEQGLLGGVLRQTLVVEDAICHAEQPRGSLGNELGERMLIAALGSPDEVCLHVPPLRGRCRLRGV